MTTIYDCAGLIERIREVGFLPLLNSEITGFSAEEMVDEDCRYVVFPDGGWDWPLWKWKGQIVTEGGVMYGKFYHKKAGFVSSEWWPHLFNYRRSCCPVPEEGSIEEAILLTLREQGSMITRELRAMCGFTGPKMRSRFDAYVTRLQMGCYIVTEDFVYPQDRSGRDYGWGWSLLTTPEQLYGLEACTTDCEPETSRRLMTEHLHSMWPEATSKQIERLIG